MSSTIQVPLYIPHPARNASVVSGGAELLHPDISFRDHSVFPEEENAITRKRVEGVVQCKLPTYQAAAVVSTVPAGVESQFFVFFKSCPELAQQSAPDELQYLLVLTYVALIFGVSATISSLVLTRNFGNVPRLIGRLQERIDGTNNSMRGFEIPPYQTKPIDFHDIAPRRWRWIEWHLLFTLIASVLCLPAQIFLYIWMFERDFIRAAVSIAGIFGMLPLLHFLPIPSRGMRDKRKLIIPLFHRGNSGTNRPGDDMLPAPMSLPPVIYTARLESQNIA